MNASMFEPLNLGPGEAYLWIFVADNCRNFRTLWYSQLHCSSLHCLAVVIQGLPYCLYLLETAPSLHYSGHWWCCGQLDILSPLVSVMRVWPQHCHFMVPYCAKQKFYEVSFLFSTYPLSLFLSWSNPNDRGNLSAMVQQCAIETILKSTIFCPNSWKYNLHQQIEFVANLIKYFCWSPLGTPSKGNLL